MKGLPTSGSENPYEPDTWEQVKSITNCYAYALNCKGVVQGLQWLIPMQPGETIYNDPRYEVGFLDKDGQFMISCVQADSQNWGFIFTEIERTAMCHVGRYKVALVIADNDYHWYRQDDDGAWSHKRGTKEIYHVDASDDVIYDPYSADRYYLASESDEVDVDYAYFIGYFEVTPLTFS